MTNSTTYYPLNRLAFVSSDSFAHPLNRLAFVSSDSFAHPHNLSVSVYLIPSAIVLTQWILTT